MKKTTGAIIGFIILLLVAGAAYYAVTSGTGKPYPLSEQIVPADALPTLTATDTSSDIERDLNSVTVTSDDSGFSDVNTDLKSL